MKLNRYFEKHRRFVVLSVFFCLLAYPAITTSQEHEKQIRNEVSRLKQIVKSSFSESENDKKIVQNYLAELENAKALSQAGYHYFGLAQLHKVHYGLMAMIYMRGNPEVVKGGQQAFDREWEIVDKRMREKEQDISFDNSKLPAAVKAISQASLNQARPYHHSSRLLSMNTGIEGGLYYLGRAQAHLDFALFCQRLNFSQDRPAPVIRSLEPELIALEERVVAGYQQPGFGKEEKKVRYNKFIGANMTIKMVRELEQGQYQLGALFKYLEALLNFEMIDQPATTMAQHVSLTTTSHEMAERLSHGVVDHSIGQLYWQMAQADLNKVDTANFDGESLKRCSVIFEHLLPEYFRVIESIN